MALPNSEKITSQLASMPDAALKQMAMMHKADPYVLPLIISEDGRRKQMRQAAMARMAAPQPKVADAAVASVGTLPEEQGIAQLQAPNIQHMADGGIAGYDEGGMAGGPASQLEFQNEPVIRMAGGGVPSYKTGGLTDKQEFAMQYKDIAEKVGKELGVDPGILISQWGLETAWGKKQVGQYNLGNIKDVSGKGPTAYDKMEKSRSSYKTYDSPDAFAADYASLIKRNFPKAVGAGADIGAFSAGLQSGEKGAYATDPNYRKVLANTFKNLPVSTAVAEEAPPRQAGEYKGEKAKDTDQSSGAGITSLAGASGAALGAFDKARQLYNTHTPLTRTGSMLRNLTPTTQLGIAAEGAGTAAAVPGIVGLGGGLLTAGVTNALSNATPEQLAQMEGFGADPSGTSFGAAIMNPENRKPENAPKMPYGEQMANVAKTIVQHPDIDRMREANKAKTEADAVPKQLGMVPVSPDEFGSATGIPEPVKEKVVDAAKAVVPEKKGFSLSDEDYLSLGLRLMASKGPLLQAAGEAGIGALADRKEREKAASDKAYKEAQTRQTSAYADLIERGGKEKNEELQAEQLIQKTMADWDRNNKIISIQDPTARMREEQRIREQIYTNMGLKPIMSAQAAPAGGGDFRMVGVRG